MSACFEWRTLSNLLACFFGDYNIYFDDDHKKYRQFVSAYANPKSQCGHAN